MKRECGQDEFKPDPRAKWTGLLEKKWTSVIRLQKKVCCFPSPLLESPVTRDVLT